MISGPQRRLRLVVAGAVAALVLGVATTVLLAATGAFRHTAPTTWRAPGTRCNAPALPGQVVDVTVANMGPGMMHGPRRRDSGSRQGYGTGTMWLRVTPGTVRAGAVSLRVLNAGSLTHEVVVLPLPNGQSAGGRPAGSDGRISETGSLGEASRSCGSGSGDGIEPGATGWTTVTLRPGRYELVCNVPGHYAAGMYTELDVTP
ncbi:sulfocyanin-like copper-binding protein [Streptomyces yokosukanensis]|uniref:sulfocyanin-like copper-binding protein n=1 Tax=Streptomyces yokosukanensis TaxID=67386 RepID=UPI0034130647